MQPGGPLAWRGRDLAADSAWIHDLTPGQVAALTNLGAPDRPACRSSGTSARHLVQLEQLLDRMRSMLLAGPGLFLLRGVSATTPDVNMLADSQVQLCRKLGTLVPQGSSGGLVSVVAAEDRIDADACHAAGHRGRSGMLPHSDSAEIASLMCIRPAASGGETILANAITIHDVMTKLSPALLALLYQDFFFDMTGKAVASPLAPYARHPVFRIEDGKVKCYFNRRRIETATQAAGRQLSAAERAAVDRLSELSIDPDISFRFTLRSGDILFLNNSHVLHGREAYQDGPGNDRGRLLLRVWFHFNRE